MRLTKLSAKTFSKPPLEAMCEQDVDYLGCNAELTLPEDTFPVDEQDPVGLRDATTDRLQGYSACCSGQRNVIGLSFGTNSIGFEPKASRPATSRTATC